MTPDLYWQEPALPDDQTSILTWEGKHPPKLVIEIVSQDTADSDYLEKPAIYQAAGVLEFWVLDLKHLGPALDSSGHKIDKRTLRRKGPKKPVAFGPYSLQVYSRMTKGAGLVVMLAKDLLLALSLRLGLLFATTEFVFLMTLSVNSFGPPAKNANAPKKNANAPKKNGPLRQNSTNALKKERALAGEQREREAKEREREAKEAALNELAELKKKLGLG